MARCDGHHFVSFLESEEDADTWHEAIVTATIGAAAVFSLVSSFVSQR